MSALLSVDKECLFWTCFLLASLRPVLFLHHVKNLLFIRKWSWHYRYSSPFLYAVLHLPEFFFFPLLPTCVNRAQMWQTASIFFHAPASVTYVCRCGGIHPSAEQQHSTATWAALKDNLVFNIGSLKVFLIAIANSHNSKVSLLTGWCTEYLSFPLRAMNIMSLRIRVFQVVCKIVM